MKGDVILIVSMSHCGSTLISNFVKQKYPRLVTGMPVFNMEDLDYVSNKPQSVHCHSPFPFENYENINLKVIYMFGNIYNIVYSYLNYGDVNKHACRYLGIDFEDGAKNLKNKNIFNFKRHFDNWNKKHTYPVLSIRYEKMWNYSDQIRSFLNMNNFKFPIYRPRKTDWNSAPESDKKIICDLYSEDYEYINSKPDFKIWT